MLPSGDHGSEDDKFEAPVCGAGMEGELGAVFGGGGGAG
jgi:hypothetical protein